MIPFFTLKRQNKEIGRQLDKAIKKVIESGVYILGPRVAEFEAAFAKYLGVKYAVGVASGTDAISLAILALGIKAGDEVIMPANSYPSVFALTSIGIVPKLVDIDPTTFTIDPNLIEKAITKKTKAIMPVHMYGRPADMEKISEIGKRYGIAIVEDCAQAHGASYCFGRLGNLSHLGNLGERSNKIWWKVGTMGSLGCFSFYPTKNLGCFGDGGMVVTNNGEIYKKVKLLRMYGEEERYNSIIPGKNSRLDEMQAAILLVKLKYLDEWNKRRREIAKLYLSNISISGSHEVFFDDVRRPSSKFDSFSSSSLSESLSPSQNKYFNLNRRQTFKASQKTHASPEMNNLKKHGLPADSSCVFHLFVIRSKRREELKKYLESKGIGTAVHYPVPVHLSQSMKFLGYKRGDFPQSERACEEVLSLPMFPELTDREIKTVAEKITNFRI